MQKPGFVSKMMESKAGFYEFSETYAVICFFFSRRQLMRRQTKNGMLT